MIRSALVWCALAVLPAPAAAEVPPWLRQAAQQRRATERATAVVLLDSAEVSISSDGRMRTVRRYAVHVHSRDGRDAATLREVYVTSSGRVRAMRGWLVPASGQARDLEDARIGDVALVDNDVYNEVRARVFTASDLVTDDSVVGIEVESEERMLFAQLEWVFDSRWSTRVARRTLTLPPGWTAKSLTFNLPAASLQAPGSPLVWELHDLPEVPDEPWMPPRSNLAPRIAVSVFGGVSPAPGQFSTWSDVSAWLQTLSAPPATPDKAVTAKAQQLVAALPQGASAFDRINAIARYVQSVQYVSIQTGLGRGGGYQPRPAELVLQRNYGDCKDKAHLMRVLLEAVGIRSYLVSLFAGDPAYVREEWPSPQQFNHAIIAVAIADAPASAAILDHPTLGPLLVFDPTDSFTPLGDLPRVEQGSLALITAAQGGSLERLPQGRALDHRVTRTIEARVSAAGELTARVTERAVGAEAAARRAEFSGGREYQDAVQRRLSSTVAGARVDRVNPIFNDAAREFTIAWEFAAARFGQVMGQLLIVRPPFNLGGRLQAPSAGARRSPVVIEALSSEEILRLELPAGVAVDEMPPGTVLDTVFGQFSLTYTMEGGRIVATRRFEAAARIVPAADYESVRQFFERIRTADATPIVLKR